VQNLAPGATERMGLGFKALKDKHPGLVVCDISGYGSTGPYRNKKAYDLLIQAEAGFLSITGSPGKPAKAGISIADIAAGTTAYNNILAALLARHKTGKGCRLDVSMLESTAEWMSFPLYYAYEGADPPGLSGTEQAEKGLSCWACRTSANGRSFAGKSWTGWSCLKTSVSARHRKEARIDGSLR
jgi:itaconate CoA-transferase